MRTLVTTPLTLQPLNIYNRVRIFFYFEALNKREEVESIPIDNWQRCLVHHRLISVAL